MVQARCKEHNDRAKVGKTKAIQSYNIQQFAKKNYSTASWIGIAIPECFSNPGISGLKNAIPGLNPVIESLIESWDWVPDFELVKISSNSLVLVSWWVLN